jgi:hypothetical protein
MFELPLPASNALSHLSLPAPQGVGDLCTDPQIHTLDGEGYGEGNLGARGMALFFR